MVAVSLPIINCRTAAQYTTTIVGDLLLLLGGWENRWLSCECADAPYQGASAACWQVDGVGISEVSQLLMALYLFTV